LSQPQVKAIYRRYIEEGDAATFVTETTRIYTLATLQRLATVGDAESRRATILALGMIGGKESIAVLASALTDSDRCVRLLADVGFSDVCRRASGAEACRRLAAAKRRAEGRRYAEALECLTQIIADFPEFAEAWFERANALFSQKEYVLAANCCQQVITRNEHHFAAYALMARCHFELGLSVSAYRFFQVSLRLNPGQEYVRSCLDVLKRSQG